ncbi:MAG: TIGR02466 family protein [Bacteroidota bacterium]
MNINILSSNVNGNLQPGLNMAFPCPIFFKRLVISPPIIDKLSKKYLKEAHDTLGTVTSNVGGWRSEEDFFESTHYEEKQFKMILQDEIMDMFSQVNTGDQGSISLSDIDLTGWVNINFSHDFKKSHVHAGAHWAGVYYLDIKTKNGSQNTGQIDFTDPRNGSFSSYYKNSPFFPPRISHMPQKGELILFPCWLYHNVCPSPDLEYRISIGVDILVKKDFYAS